MALNYEAVCDQDLTREVLLRARWEIQGMLEASNQRTRVSLFLPYHYPFFHKSVQRVLMERHPEKRQYVPANYAVDGYLWAEQLAWVAYDDSPLRNPAMFEEHASFYFTHDLRWFSRLLTSITDAIEPMLKGIDSAGPRVVALQAWVNQFGEGREAPSAWLRDTVILKAAKKKAISNLSGENASNSIRVTAARINRDRRAIFARWLPSWQAELEYIEACCANL